jgi:hypothetical protein
MEDRKAAAAPPMTQKVSQFEHVVPAPMKPQSKSATITD